MVPALRFKNENGEDYPDWSNTSLLQVSTKISYGIGAAAKKFDGDYQYLRITDIDEKSRKFSPNPLVSPNSEQVDKYVLEEGDIVFARTGASVGKSYLYDKKDGRLIYAGFLIKFHINNAIPRFIFLLTFRTQYDNWVKIHSVRSGQQGLNAEDYKNWKFLIPCELEQQKIADFLSSVDKKIGQLTRKKELLEKYKTGMMQKLFPKAGEQHPELRFKDENGQDFPDWNEKKLGSLKDLKHGDGDWILTENITNDERYKVIQLGHIGYGKFQEKEYKTISEDAFEEVKGTLIHKGDLLINRMIDSARVNLCLFPFDGDFITSVDVCWLRSSDYFQNKFLLYSLITYANQKGLLRLSSGSGRIRISKKNIFYRHSIKFPSLSEQQKIADFLSAIDDKITKVEGKLTKAQTFKKGLLQQMFV